MRYYGVIQRNAGAYNHIVRNMLGQLDARMKVTGQRFGVWRRFLDDGTIICVQIIKNGVSPIYRVYVLEGESDSIVTFTCDMINGLFDLVNLTDPVSTGALNFIYPRTIEGSYGDRQSTPALNAQFTGEAGECNSAVPQAKSISANRGAYYTGQMRKVVQLLGGRADPINYDYSWCRTHGIYINPVDDVWWVVEISIARGVVAWQLPICELLTQEQMDLLGIDIPIIPETGAALTGEGYIELITPEDLAPVYAGATPFYEEMGWAFNYTGTEAQNVFVTKPDSWKRSARWSVGFTYDAGGAPIGASFAKEEEGYLYGGNKGAPKYPTRKVNHTSLASFDLTYDAPGAPPEDMNSPFWVQFVEWSSDPVIVRGRSTGKPPTELIDTEIPEADRYECELGDYFQKNPSTSGTYYYKRTVYTAQRYYQVDGPLVLPEAPTPLWVTPVDEKTEYWAEKTGENTGTANSRRVYTEHWTAHRTLTLDSGREFGFQQGLLIPFGDREQFYLAHMQTEVLDYQIIRDSWSGFAFGQVYELMVREYSANIDDDVPCEEPNFFWHQVGYPGTCDPPLPPRGLTDFEGLDFGAINMGDKITVPMLDAEHCDTLHSTSAWCTSEDNSYTTSCGSGKETELENSDLVFDARTTVYAIDKTTQDFVKVVDEDEFDTFSPWVTEIDGVDTKQRLFALEDVFTKGGVLSTSVNPGLTDALYLGNVGTHYPLDTLWNSYNVGFYGVPVAP